MTRWQILILSGLGLGVVVWVCWLVVMLVHGRFAEAFFYFFVGMGTISALLLHQIWTGTGQYNQLVVWLHAAAWPEGFWGRLGWLSANIVLLIYLMLTWPELWVTIFAASRFEALPESAPRFGGRGPENWKMWNTLLMFGHISNLSLAAVTFGLALHPSYPNRYVIYLFTIYIFALMARQIQYIVRSGTALSELKRIPGNPLVKFGLVLASDLVTLVLSLTAIGSWESHKVVGWSDLWATAQRVVSLSALEHVVLDTSQQTWWQHLMSLNYVEKITFVAGLLFYFVAVRTALGGFKEFKRNEDDIVAMAAQLSAVGEFKKALKLIDPLNQNTKTLQAKIAPCIALGYLDRAESFARLVLTMRSDSDRQVMLDDIYCLMFSEYERFTMKKEVRVRLWSRAIEKKINRGLLAKQFAGYQLAAANPDDVRNLLEAGDEETTKLANVCACYRTGRFEEGLSLLEAFEARDAAEQLIHLCFRGACQLRLVEEEAGESFADSWMELHQAKLLELSNELSNGAEWQRSLANFMVNALWSSFGTASLRVERILDELRMTMVDRQAELDSEESGDRMAVQREVRVLTSSLLR